MRYIIANGVSIWNGHRSIPTNEIFEMEEEEAKRYGDAIRPATKKDEQEIKKAEKKKRTLISRLIGKE